MGRCIGRIGLESLKQPDYRLAPVSRLYQALKASLCACVSFSKTLLTQLRHDHLSQILLHSCTLHESFYDSNKPYLRLLEVCQRLYHCRFIHGVSVDDQAVTDIEC